jgi:hypothetical protein
MIGRSGGLVAKTQRTQRGNVTDFCAGNDPRKHPRLKGGKSPVRFRARGFSEKQNRLKKPTS